MPNYLAVANTTAVLKYMVESWVAYTIPDLDIRVTSLQPKQTEDIYRDSGGVNIYLYQTEFSSTLRNDDNAVRDSHGNLISQPLVPLDLYYLVTFFGDEQKYVAQRLFGTTTELFNIYPYITHDLVRATNTVPANAMFKDSGLDKQHSRISITPCNLSLEEKSKMWSFFFQTPYHLSSVFRVSSILIEGNYPLPKMHKVLTRNIHADTITNIQGGQNE